MKLLVLSDNRAQNPDLCIEHGLSVYLESETHTFLLDTGQEDVFVKNAQKIGIELGKVDYVFLSHGHKDHTGGLEYFRDVNSKAEIIFEKELVNTKYFSNRRDGTLRDISGYIPTLYDKVKLVQNWYSIDNSNHCFGMKEILYPLPKGNLHLYKGQQNEINLDDFNSELIFVSEFKDGLFVYTGCAHRGILNILKAVEAKFHKKVSIALGGFHLIDGDMYENINEIKSIAQILKLSFPQTQLYTGHCTGDRAYQLLKDELGEQIHLFYTGFELVF